MNLFVGRLGTSQINKLKRTTLNLKHATLWFCVVEVMAARELIDKLYHNISGLCHLLCHPKAGKIKNSSYLMQ